MAEPRATSTAADELAATISALKSRLNELESASGSGIPPVGTILDYLGSIAPSGWTLLDGTTITNGRLLYPALWNVLPNIYKSGDNILKPDTRGRVLVHRSASGTLNVDIGTVGGVETVTLSATEMPVHNHGLGSHSHSMAHTHVMSSDTDLFAPGTNASFVAVNVSGTIGAGSSTQGASTPNTGAATGNTNDAGGSGGITQAHNNLQPYMVVVKILRLV